MKDKVRADKARKEIRDFLAGQGRIKGIKSTARNTPPSIVHEEITTSGFDQSFDRQTSPTGFEDQIFLPFMGPSSADFVPFLQPPPSFQGHENPDPDRYPPDDPYLPAPPLAQLTIPGVTHINQDESALVSGTFCPSIMVNFI
jgi:hypothetical protein